MSLVNKFIDRIEPSLKNTISYLRTATSYLTPKDDWVEGLKQRLCIMTDPFTRPLGRPLIRERGRADYVCTVDTRSDEVERVLASRYQRNLASTRKFRVIEGNRDWADGSWVHDSEDTPWQHHVYLFDNDDGTCDVYGHKETSAEHDPYGHVTDGMIHGDPDGITRGTLEEGHLDFE